MGNSASSEQTLPDGTIVGERSKEGEAFAKAIARMHCIFRDCDEEFASLSEAANTHGKQSEEYKAAGKQLEACQKRRIRQFHIIEAVCGPAQGGYGECVRDKGSARAVECLPLLQTFLDCAERALDEKDVGRSEPS